jgi:hypothetical protein
MNRHAVMTDIDRTSGPAQLALCLAAVALVLPLAPPDDAFQVIDADSRTIELSALVSARNAPQSWDPRCEMREKLIAFIRDEMPEALPRERAILIPSGGGDDDFLWGSAAPEKMRANARN